MPIFEYECSVCEHEFEKLVKLNEIKKRVRCPECKSWANRTLSGFKGRAHDDNPVWLDHNVRQILGDDVRTRTDWKRCLKENHLIPVG